ncbi:MAG TPA: lysine--tRNA ligase [Gammaproteobacteria bacterium]|nr:lysine--tRNA ligase [Gammaproteobacteria bacterium]
MTEEISQNELLALRRAKLDDLRSKGNAFPNNFKRNALAADLHSSYDSFKASELEKKKVAVSVAGRIMLQRIMGKASFITLQDLSGQIQVYIKSDNVDEETYKEFKKWDLGDVVGIKGKLFKTKTNELTVDAESIFLLTKSLRPLPEKHVGLVDTEQRYRKRYLDLLTNEESLMVFKTRSKLISEIRNIFHEEGYLEVETPMMQPVPGGAAARPFVTHHNALDMDLYLRVAPELYLKRLVIGGLERVFEINRNFRNEGLSTKHNPEFTMLEYYTAYADYKDQMDFMQTLLNTLAKRVLGKSVIETEGNKYDLSKPFERMTLIESIVKYLGADKRKLEDRKELEKIAKKLNVEKIKDVSKGKLLVEIFEKGVEDKLDQPTFIEGYPKDVSPLSRTQDEDSNYVERFELFIGGREIANGFSELNDPDEQSERFKQQVEQRASGDQEAMEFDEDYVEALEYGLPPCAGVGVGIDRLVMLFTGRSSIKDVLLFPQLKPKRKD